MNLTVEYGLIAVAVIGVLVVHWWLSRRPAVWLGAVVPVVAVVAFAYALSTLEPVGLRDYFAPVAGLAVLLWMWVEGAGARRRAHAGPAGV
jgi:hypothetical protein